MSERETPYGEIPPGKKYVKISPESWDWGLTDMSQRVLKTIAIAIVGSVVGLTVSIAEHNTAGIKASTVALTLLLPTFFLIAAKERIESRVRRGNNITRPRK